MKSIHWLLVIALLQQACGSLRHPPKYELGTGYYKFKQDGSKFQPVFVEVTKDTVHVYPEFEGEKISIIPTRDEVFQNTGFDVDLTTAIFKYRNAQENLPRQVNYEFNGSVYLGYRIDRYQVHYTKTPAGLLGTLFIVELHSEPSVGWALQLLLLGQPTIKCRMNIMG